LINTLFIFKQFEVTINKKKIIIIMIYNFDMIGNKITYKII